MGIQPDPLGPSESVVLPTGQVMDSSRPFDPIPQIARYLHPSACGVRHDFDNASCLVATAAAKELHEGLEATGLVVLPSTVANFVSRRFDEMTAPEAPETAQPGPAGMTSFLYTEIVRIRSRRRDGTTVQTEPMSRPLAEIVLVDFGMSHDSDVVAAMIEAEPSWIDGLLADLGQNYTGWAA
jgi:hypothetical protein